MRTQVPSEMVIAYQAEQMTVYDIAFALGKAPSTVWQALKNQSVDTTTYRKRLEDRNREVVKACKLLTFQEVGKLFRITKQRVQQIVKRQEETVNDGRVFSQGQN